jgi:predicted transcriptional regulator
VQNLAGCPLDQKTALAVLLVMLALTVSFTVTASTPHMFPEFLTVQHSDNLQRLTISVPVVIGAGLHSNSSPLLNQPTRLEINNFVKSNPGVHFRGICDGLGLSVGVVQYHLNVLEHAGMITSYLDGQNKRYFESNVFSQSDMQLISTVRHETTGKILAILNEKPSALHRDLACTLGISSQAVTWQMNQLKKSGLINAETTGIHVKYSLSNQETINRALYLTKTSLN